MNDKLRAFEAKIRRVMKLELALDMIRGSGIDTHHLRMQLRDEQSRLDRLRSKM